MNIVMMGPPGCGKGTQGHRLARATGAEHISTGAMLRAEADARTDLGTTVAGLVARGALVSDELMAAIAVPRIEAAAARAGYVLDGYPRSTAQAELLLSCAAPPELVVVLDVPDDVLVERIVGRAEAEGRSDDTPEVLADRLRVYRGSTQPVLALFGERGIMRVIDADSPVDEIAARILDLVAEHPAG